MDKVYLHNIKTYIKTDQGYLFEKFDLTVLKGISEKGQKNRHTFHGAEIRLMMDSPIKITLNSLDVSEVMIYYGDFQGELFKIEGETTLRLENPFKREDLNKVYIQQDEDKSMLPEDVIYDFPNSQGTKELNKIDIPFSFAKPSNLIRYVMEFSSLGKDYYVLDFFSGSATTAHAVMQLNAEDGGNRKFIMVQLPEKTDEKSEAYKAGYKNICEIGKERIRRAGEQIKKELIEKKQKAGMLDENITDPNQLDIGFKVFKLDETNIKPWDSSLEVDEKTLLSQIEVIKEKRTKEDVLYEILLKYGVFNESVKELSMNGQTIYSIAENYMIVNLNERISSDDIKSIAQLKPSVVVFLENGFADDNQKINAEATLKHQGIEDVKCI